MSSNLKSNPIQAESIMPLRSAKSISVSTDGVSFTPSKSSVAKSGEVTLKSTAGSDIPVFTHVGTALTAVFNEGDPPYSATTGSGTKYTLKSSIAGDVALDFTDPAPTFVPALGGNGTINVGG